jgi:hypothetical protein
MTTCPVTVWPSSSGYHHDRVSTCGLPLAPGARFCVGHEADRVRLGGGR